MLAGICPPERLRALVKQLRNPATFNRPIPVPSLAACDPNYNPEGTYWTGGVWAPTNYMIARGLQLAGEGDEAHRVARAYLEGLAATWREFTPHTLWEANCPEGPVPGKQPYTGNWVKPDFVGWSGLGPTAMLIEQVMGIDIDALANRVTWTIRLTEEHGIEALKVAGGVLSLHCQAREAGSPARVKASWEGPEPCHLTIARDSKAAAADLMPGQEVSVTV